MTMRYTVVDPGGTASFVGPGHLMKMLTAACSRGPIELRALLALTEEFDPRLVRTIVEGLAHFDLGRSPGLAAVAGGTAPSGGATSAAEPFRVVNELTRRQSLAAASAGLVVFNLPAKRIVQIQNSYAELQRRDRGRLRRDGRPVRAYYSYELPPDWTIVP